MNIKLFKVIDDLKILSAGRRIKTPAPDDALLSEYENDIGFVFSDEYKFFLKNASTIFFGTKEPLIATRAKKDRSELSAALQEARQIGVPADWLPICEDNGDYYCIVPGGQIRFWSHDGVTTESWQDLADWIKDVWISGN
ncbi:SMI1/KNR4 family protein [Burkholderia metallica]|uniref:SMI1/KNR4 family protein n=1 Tax=Burkholderia metallica TaxID=488729 RepID=UPI00157B18F6|nr:SMI1/KNR4 family protein [Burkholderia metallica]NTZ81709.1 SMI1/KNR4 family protein [Burkholderia metallica]